MATRFYFEAGGAATVSPAFDAGWEQTGEAVRRQLTRKTTVSVLATVRVSTTVTVPITTTQDILVGQFVSDPIPPQRIIGNLSFVNRVLQNVTTDNVTMALVVRVVSQDGGTVRGTLFSTFSVDTAWPTTAATRIQAATAITELTTQPGDRLVVECGAHAAAPSTSGTCLMRFGYTGVADFALTTALTTDLNPWIEFSQDIWAGVNNNYQAPRAGDGMSVSEKLR